MVNSRTRGSDVFRTSSRVTQIGYGANPWCDELTVLTHSSAGAPPGGAVRPALSAAGMIAGTLDDSYGCGAPPAGRERPRGGAAKTPHALPVAVRGPRATFATVTRAPFPAAGRPDGGMDTPPVEPLTPRSHPCDSSRGNGEAWKTWKVRFTAGAGAIIAPQTLHDPATRRNLRAPDGWIEASDGGYHTPRIDPCSTRHRPVGQTRAHTPERPRARSTRHHRTAWAAATPLRDLDRCGGGATACSSCPHPFVPPASPRERLLCDVRTVSRICSIRRRGTRHAHVAVAMTGLAARGGAA